jgi:hypothetical protein
MEKLEHLTEGALVRGAISDRAIKLVAVEWHGSNAITLTFIDELAGKPARVCRTAMTWPA